MEAAESKFARNFSDVGGAGGVGGTRSGHGAGGGGTGGGENSSGYVKPFFKLTSLETSSQNPVNEFSINHAEGKITFVNPHTAVDDTLYPDADFYKPTEYETFFKIDNNKQITLFQPYTISENTSGNLIIPEQLNNLEFSMSFEGAVETTTTSSVFQSSYADITLGNLRTYSGDVHRAKVYTKRKSQQTAQFEKIGDFLLQPNNELVDTSSVTGLAPIGLFHSQSVIDNNWVTSSNTANASVDNSQYMAAVKLSGSNSTDNGSFTFITKNNISYEKREDYQVTFDLYYEKADKVGQYSTVVTDEAPATTTEKHAEIEVFLSGSIESGNDNVRYSLGSFSSVPNQDNFTDLMTADSGSIKRVFNIFRTHNISGSIVTGSLGFEVSAGNFHIANLAITPFSDANFNPGFVKARLPMPFEMDKGQQYDFLTEFYDFNNNKANYILQTSASVIFNGPETVITGDNSVLTGSMYLSNLAGGGIELHGGSSYLRSIGYNGFNRTISESLGGFLIFSGSVSESMGTSESYQGVGLEIVDAHTSQDRFFKFRTNPSTFQVVTDDFFFGRQASTFVSGSEGKLEISSSNFHLDNDGSLTMQGQITATAGGTIGGFTIASSSISNTNFFLSGSNYSGAPFAKTDLVLSSSGFVVNSTGSFKAITGEIGSFSVDSTTISSSNDALIMNSDGRITGSNVLFSGGKIARWTINGNKLESINATGKGIILDADPSSPKMTITASSVGANANKIELYHTDDDDYGIIGKQGGINVFLLGDPGGQGNRIASWSFNDKALTAFSSSTQDKFGISLDADVQLITIHGNSGEGKNNIGPNDRDNVRVAIGQLSTNAGAPEFGIKGFSTGDGSANSGQRIFELSSVRNEIAGWTFDNQKISSSNLNISSSGLVETSDYASGLRGFRLSAEGNGFLEVENARIRGTLKTAVFEKETVNAVGGQLLIANSTTISGSPVTASEQTMSVENASGFEANDILAIKKVSNSGFTTEYVKVESASFHNTTNASPHRGKLMVVRGYSGSTSTASGSVGDLASSAQNYEEGQVIVSTGKSGSGYIRLNANPNDPTTPYIDIVERTGSAIYDVDLKARLGDLSGLSTARLHGTAPTDAGFGLFAENVFLQGKIVATSGSIGGIDMSSNKIFNLNSGTTPTFNDANTNFYLDSDGNFSLRNKLSFNQSTGVLNVDGTLTVGSLPDVGIVSGSAQIASDISGSGNATSASLAASASSAVATGSTLTTDSSSLAARVKIVPNEGISVENSSGVSLTSLSNTLRVGQIGDNKSRLEIDTDGNLKIINRQGTGGGATDTTVVQLDKDGNGQFSGAITASGGTIGGFNIGTDLDATSGTLKLKGASGQLTASAAQITGKVTATSGDIGGWTIDSDKINKLSGSNSDVNAGIILDSANNKIVVSGSGEFTTKNSVVLEGNTGTFQVSQSGQGIFNSGQTFAFVVRDDRIVKSIPTVIDSSSTSPITQMSDAQVLNNITTQKQHISQLFRQSVGAYEASGSYHIVSINDTSVKGPTTASEPGATAFVFNKDVRYTSGFTGAKSHLGGHTAFISNHTQTTGNAGRFVGNTTGSAEYLFFTRVSGSQWEDAKFVIARLEADVSGASAAQQKEFVYLEGRAVSGSDPHANTIFQIQHDGHIISKGNITAFGTAFNNVSDERLKKNVHTISQSLDKVLELRPTEFVWKENNKQDVGFIAQEVEEVIPEVVDITEGFLEEGKKDKEEIKAVSYTKLVPYLVDTIQVLTKRIEKLEKINDL